jgi:hypothetical protein
LMNPRRTLKEKGTILVEGDFVGHSFSHSTAFSNSATNLRVRVFDTSDRIVTTLFESAPEHRQRESALPAGLLACGMNLTHELIRLSSDDRTGAQPIVG